MPTTRPTTMAAVVLDRYGPADVLHLAEVPRPVPRPGEVLVRVAAVAVSAAEAAMRAADPPVARLATGLRGPRNRVMGAEIAGEVVEVGADADGALLGARVVAATGVSAGGYAELAAVPAAGVVRVPDGTDLVDAVAVTEGGLTALPFLRDHGEVGAGTRLLVIGAAGAVGASAVQLAADLGAHVTGVCSTPHVELVRSLGAAEVIDRTAGDPLERAGEYDVVLDAVGGSSYRRCRPHLAPHGIYLTTVPDLGVILRTPFARVLRERRAAIAFTGLRSHAAKAADMAHLLDLAAQGRIEPVVDRRFPLAEAAAAHRYVEEGHKAGTVVLVP